MSNKFCINKSVFSTFIIVIFVFFLLAFYQKTINTVVTRNNQAAVVKDQLTKELEQKVIATQIPVIEYHYPGYAGAGAEMPKDLFLSQMNFLKEGNFKTLTDLELASFLDNTATFPAKSVVLRIDQGSGANFPEFESMIKEIKNRGFKAIVFVTSGGPYSQENWDKLTNWVKEGVISLGSHSATHPDFRAISKEQAINEAKFSKAYIETKLANAGISRKVVSFAFPYDSIPDNLDFLKSTGYKYAIGGIVYSYKNNAAKPGQFLLGSLYPYVSTSMLKTISANSSNNPRSIILVGNYTYDALIFYNLTPITKQIAENTTNTRYTELSFGKYTRYLTVTSDQETHLTKPEGIVIHTDDQSGTGYFNWNSINTYYGLQERKTDAHFAVGRDGIGQFLKMYKDIVTPSNGASGFSNYIDIEMCGREYNDILNPSANADKKMVIEEITAKTIQLVIKLIDTYQINLNNVLGHYAASASGKTDPGKNYMENYFLPILRQTYWSTHKENVTVTPLVERTITPIRRRTVTPV